MDAEGEARQLLERHLWDMSDVPGARRLVEAALGKDAVRRVPPSALRGAEGELARVNGAPRVYLSSRLGPLRSGFVALHELAHHHLGTDAHGSPELEALCDAIAGALLCPRRAFRAAVSAHGMAWAQIAIDFNVEESCAILRYGEVMGEPLALVAPRSVRVRGQDWTWPDERGLRRLARAGGPGVARTELAGDTRRVVLLADDAA